MKNLLCALLISGAASAAVPTGFVESTYTSNQLTPATSFAWAPDGTGRLFITNKNGTVRIAKLVNGALETSTGSTLVLSTFATEPNVHTNSEGGLLSVSFDPNFVSNHFVYFFVSVSPSQQQIVRYTDVDGVGTARTVIVPNLPTAGQNHVGGATGFGPDGKLYWAIGDLGNGTGVDADLTSLAAKVGRANLDGTPDNDNPFFDGVGPNNEYVWARGFRNPFTFTFRPEDGVLWVNCVGTGYEQVFAVRRGDHAGYNDYENNQPAGFITPLIKYRTNGTDARSLTATGAERSASGALTFTTTGVHGFRVGERITVAGVADASFNGTYTVTSTPSATTWTAQGTGAAASSGNGSATTKALGGSITGGTFYDASLLDAPNRGAFFWGDYNSGQLSRALIASDGGVESVDEWGTGFSSAVDVEVGPDGALYVIGVTSGSIKRIKPTMPGAKLVVSNRNVRVVEGGRARFTVALSEAPTADVTVNVSAPAGVGPTLSSGATLNFTTGNWAVPQVVELTAADDANTDSETTLFTVAATGYGAEQVTARSIDNNGVRLVLSSATVSVPEGGTQDFTVALSKAPGGTLTVNVARTAGSNAVTVTTGGTLTFNTSNWMTPQTVTLSAGNDANNVDETATVTVTAPGADARNVAVTVLDDEPVAPLITSMPTLTAVVGAPWTYDVEAAGRPAVTFTLTGPASASIDGATGLISWTPASVGTQNFVVTAANGVMPNATQMFDVVVSADQAPTIALTRPTLEEVVGTSTMGEFYGDCFDDVGCTRAEFFVDGALISTDVNTGGHYHAFGEHNRWDSTGLSAGAHLVKMKVFDTAGQSAELERRVCVGAAPCEFVLADAGVELDAGVEMDAGVDVDAGVEVDAGVVADAGVTVDAGTQQPGADAGVDQMPDQPSGCGCTTSSGGALWALMALGALLRRRRFTA
ncbi:MAG: hypothetical protein DI536_34880 [Archangium gephyra]|uniref:Glucose/Sorbosone dehydrogenase domain-containing protein n=1 Tax=Archangium gephyra TaxID=48 RepID=A0A2W5U5N6_9BACT|nr:MAG: hypothetical protein DI536_34880 [Archangium gephyra]